MNQSQLNLLTTLFTIASPSGDEKVMADWLTDWLHVNLSPAPQITRLRDCLIVTKGESPQVALFAHIDTCGFTVGYGNDFPLIPIGSPQFTPGAAVKRIGGDEIEPGHIWMSQSELWYVATGLDMKPGDRLVYSTSPIFHGDTVRSPYQDNRAGVWAALQALQDCENVCVCFTTGEETGGSGAIICSRHIYDKLGITKALISDITWDTQHVHCGDGVAISRRDRWVPSQSYLDRVVGLATRSGIKFQIEIESSGGSDGGGIERSGCPIDWAFVGAPEKMPHSDIEELDLNDLEAMAQMLTYLVDGLTTD